MMRSGALLAIVLAPSFALAISACPSTVTPPPNFPVDADAAYVATEADVTPTICEAACNAMTAVCGLQLATCVDEMTTEDQTHMFRTPSGQPRTCAAIAAATTKAAMVNLGVSCP